MRALQLTTTPRPFFDQQVAALEARGVECSTLSVPRTGEDGRVPTDYVRYLPGVLREVGAGESYDLVHANYGLVAPYAVAAARLADVPLVVTFWGTDLMGPEWLRRLGVACASAADAVILPSRAMADALDGDYTYVPFGVDTDLFRPIPKDEARERVGWPDEENVALFPYDPDRPEKDYERAKRVVSLANADARLRSISGVDYEEVPYYFNAADALLVTSERESGPMVVKEAAACNVPVVSTDVGFAADAVGDVTHSTVSDDDDALAAGLDAAFGGGRSDGREVVSGLSVETMGDRLAGLYDRVLDRRGDDRSAGRERNDRVSESGRRTRRRGGAPADPVDGNPVDGNSADGETLGDSAADRPADAPAGGRVGDEREVRHGN
ncbi:glycosyltransferase [Halorussus vallis]|uniref:glycosyltransferase n=2 Tax=Halorussus TaxID=1070314 RepID=UPI0034A16B07